jgi:hypothetical protein
MTDDTPSFAISVRIQPVRKGAYRGRRRHDLREGPQPNYVDGDRSHLNSVILAAPMPGEMRRTSIARRAAREGGVERALKVDAAIATAGVISFGRGLQDHVRVLPVEQQDALYRAVSEAMSEACAAPVLGLVAHRDETAPHGHLWMPAFADDGQAVSKRMTPSALSKMQEAAMVAARPWLPMIQPRVTRRNRIERGDDASKIYHRSVRQLHEDLPAELAVAAARVEEMQGRVDQLVAREARTEREERRLSTYRRRLADRVLALQEAQAAHAATAVAIDEARADLDRDRQAMAIRERVLDAAETELDGREEELKQREQRLRHVERSVAQLIGEVADRFGVGHGLRAVRDAIRDAIGRDDGPEPG